MAKNVNRISIISLMESPLFLRFNEIRMGCSNPNYIIDKHSIEKKCGLFETYFRQLKTVLENANVIVFDLKIDLFQRYPNRFKNHLELLNYLSNKLLPMCDFFNGYKFCIEFDNDWDAGTDVISAILQLPKVIQSSKVQIVLHGIKQPTQLPIEAISNWLHRKFDDGLECISTKQSGERFLLIHVYSRFQNDTAIVDHLKEVSFILFYEFNNE